MAAVIDVGFLQNFSHIFAFLLIFTMTYGVLRVTNIFGGRVTIDVFLAFILGIVSLFSSLVVKTITRAAPWFVVLMIFAVFILMVFRMFGYPEDMIVKGTNVRMIAWFLIFLCLMISLGSFFSVLAEEKGGVPGPGQIVTVETIQAGYTAPNLAPGEIITTTEGVKRALTQPGQPTTQKSEFWNTLFHPNVLGLGVLMLIGLFAALRLSGEKE